MPDSNLTKNALAASMKKLMRRKPFAKISVSDICDECGMNRKSFYYHFKDKYELVNWIFYEDFISGVALDSYRNEWELFDELCRYFYEEKEFYKSALEVEGQNSFREYFSEALEPVVRYFLNDMLKERQKKSFYLTFFCEGYLAAVMRWLTEGFRIPPEEFLDDLHFIACTLAKRMLFEDKEKKSE